MSFSDSACLSRLRDWDREQMCVCWFFFFSFSYAQIFRSIIADVVTQSAACTIHLGVCAFLYFLIGLSLFRVEQWQSSSVIFWTTASQFAIHHPFAEHQSTTVMQWKNCGCAYKQRHRGDDYQGMIQRRWCFDSVHPHHFNEIAILFKTTTIPCSSGLRDERK